MGIRYAFISLLMVLCVACQKGDMGLTSVEGRVFIHGNSEPVAGARVAVIGSPAGCYDVSCRKEIIAAVSNKDGSFLLAFDEQSGMHYQLEASADGFMDVTRHPLIKKGTNNAGMDCFLGYRGCIRFILKDSPVLDSLSSLRISVRGTNYFFQPLKDTTFTHDVWAEGNTPVEIVKYYPNWSTAAFENPFAPVGDTLDYIIEY